MRIKIFIFLVFIFSHIACDKSVNPIIKDEIYVTKFNIEGMRKKHLPDFELVRKRMMWNRGRRFIYENENAQISIQVGLHSSAKDAEDIALDYMNYLSIVLVAGPILGESIGDKLWWRASNSDQNNITSIVFIRNNALFIISSRSYKKIKELAKAIDMDIVNNADYVDLENSISLPKIHSITATKTELKEGETGKITVNASDPDDEPLEYVFNFGLFHVEPDPENVFTFKASRDYVPEPFWGSHILKFIVFNESNVISEVAELEIKISQ